MFDNTCNIQILLFVFFFQGFVNSGYGVNGIAHVSLYLKFYILHHLLVAISADSFHIRIFLIIRFKFPLAVVHSDLSYRTIFYY